MLLLAVVYRIWVSYGPARNVGARTARDFSKIVMFLEGHKILNSWYEWWLADARGVKKGNMVAIWIRDSLEIRIRRVATFKD